MIKNSLFAKRTLRICYWDSEKRHFGLHKAVFEKKLKSVGEIELYELQRFDDPNFSPCDLLVVAAETVPEERFGGWLKELKNKIKQQNKIWVPALILSNANFESLEELFADIVKSNWYFDIVHADHMNSLPMRVANLLRIHDHLHELQRYGEQQQTMQNRLLEIEKLLQAKKSGAGS